MSRWDRAVAAELRGSGMTQEQIGRCIGLVAELVMQASLSGCTCPTEAEMLSVTYRG